MTPISSDRPRSFILPSKIGLHGVLVSAFICLCFVTTDSSRFSDVKADSIAYLNYAKNLVFWQTFSRIPTENPQPQATREPGYPFFLAAVIAIDPALRNLSDESYELRDKTKFSHLFYVQHALFCLSCLLLLPTCWLLMRTVWPGYLAALFLYFGTFFSRYVPNRLLSENVILFLFSLFSLLLLLTVSKQHKSLYLLSGVVLGAMALTRASFYYFAPLLFLYFCFLAYRNKRLRRKIMAGIALFAVGYAAVVGSWMTRNWVQLESFKITERGGHILNLRSHMNGMNSQEWAASFWYFAPNGSTLKHYLGYLISPNDVGRLNPNSPESFRNVARTERQELFAKYDDRLLADAELMRRAKERILTHPVRHLAACVPLGYRGIFIEAPWIAMGMILSFFGTLFLAMWRRDTALVAFLLPTFFVLAFHTAATHNNPRYNMIAVSVLLVCLMLFVSYLLRRGLLFLSGVPGRVRFSATEDLS